MSSETGTKPGGETRIAYRTCPLCEAGCGLEIGLTGVAVPVHGTRGDVVAALGISGPTPRLEGRLDDLGRGLLDHATALSSLLRGPAPDPRRQHTTVDPNARFIGDQMGGGDGGDGL